MGILQNYHQELGHPCPNPGGVDRGEAWLVRVVGVVGVVVVL